MTTKKTTTTYRLRNWKEYNAALVQRGSLTLWVSDDVVATWQQGERTGRPGAPRTYSETAILTMATLQEVYHLPLRAAEGLAHSVLQLLGVELAVPDYSTLCRRRQQLEVVLPRSRRAHEPLHVVVDSTGVKVYGEGEWKVRQHGYTRRRTAAQTAPRHRCRHARGGGGGGLDQQLHGWAGVARFARAH